MAVSLSTLRETVGIGFLEALHQALGSAGVGAVRLLRGVWSVLTKQQRKWVLWTQALSILMACSTVVGIASIAPFFAVLGDPRLISHSQTLDWLYTHFAFASVRSFEIALGLAFMATVCAANAVNVAGAYLMIKLSYRISAELQSSLLDEYLHRSYFFQTQTNSAVLCNKVINETNRLTNDILQNAFPLVTNLLTGILIVISVTLLNPAVAALIIVTMAGGYSLIYLAVRDWLAKSGEIQSQLLVEQAKTLSESFGAIKEILVLGIQDFFRGKFAAASLKLARASASGRIAYQSPKYLMECVTVGVLVALALAAGGDENGMGPRLGPLTFVGFAAYRLLPILQQAFAALVRVRSESAGFNAIAPDLRLAQARRRSVPEGELAQPHRPQTVIDLREVCFGYDAARVPALNGVSMQIPARMAIGIIGANGSGKTTLVDVIAGLLVPASGELAVDGIPVDDANRAAWQSRIAYVPQNVFLLDSSIAENVALGVPLESIDRVRLEAAAHLAHLDELVMSLPGGYEHVIGERGVRLSGGQRQRLGIARALYTNATVLILDEATNALDGLTEQELMATVMRLRGRYTIILIAHRSSSVRSCDLIFELEHGKVRHAGSYAELLGDSENFRRLVSAQ
jgi:ATP-binding cassette, subfamily B, bacterial PglK